MDETGRVEIERVKELRDQVEAIDDDMTFSAWLVTMSLLQEVAYGAHYREMDPETKADSIRMNFTACVHELVEMTQEMGWKPWSSPQGWVNEEAAMGEAVDAMHFLANLLSHCRATGVQLTAAYKAKMLKNLDRQINGYNVRFAKCADCGRDLDEAERINGTPRLTLLQGTAEERSFCDTHHRDRYYMGS